MYEIRPVLGVDLEIRRRPIGVLLRVEGLGLRMSGCLDSPQFESNYVTEMCSGSEAGSYLKLIDSVHHSTPGLRVIKKEKVAMPRLNPEPSPQPYTRGGSLIKVLRAENARLFHIIILHCSTLRELRRQLLLGPHCYSQA